MNRTESASTSSTPTPPAFDLSEDSSRAARPTFDLGEERVTASSPTKRLRRGGLWGGIFALALALLKFGGAGKLLLTFGSLFGSIWFTAVGAGMGWALAAGIFLMVFVHECGHALAAHRFGLKMAGMVFTPLGGVVMHRRGNTNVVQDAFIGIMGPVAGTLYGIVCVALGFALQQRFYFGLAGIVFIINFANLVPGAPLDGGWIGAVFSKTLSPVWRAGAAGAGYFRARPIDKVKYGFAWGGLALFLLIGFGVCRALAASMPPS